MISDFYVFLNCYSYGYSADSSYYGVRDEPCREHEKKLWTLFQIVKNDNVITITNQAKQVIKKIENVEQLKDWIAKTYPGFVNQLENKIYTKYPHPTDSIE